jgi:hypothetical protein
MVTVAVLSESIAAQIREKPDEMPNVQVIWSGSDVSALKARTTFRPQVVIADLENLGPDPKRELEELHRTLGCQLTIVTYSFARRELIHGINGERSRALRVPVHLGSLRLSMLSLLVKDVFRHDRPAEGTTTERAPSSGSPRPFTTDMLTQRSAGESVPVGTPLRYTPTQLGRLQEITSSINCECPNHLAGIVTSLAAFEEYSKNCLNRDPDDAAIHAHLYRETSRARHLVEEALRILCEYEKIAI